MQIEIPHFNQRNALLFLLPILTVPTVNVVGELMFSDIAVAILAPLMLLNRNLNFKQPYLNPIMWLLTIWLIGVIISDAVNGSSMGNFLRGIAAVIFFGLHLFVFFVLIDGKRERYISAIIGSAVTVLIQWATANEGLYSLDLTDTPWKMGVGFAVTILFVVFLGMLRVNERVKGKLLFILSPIHLFLNARSLFLVTILAGVFSAFQLKVPNKKTRQILIIGVLTSVVVLFPVATSIYGSLNEAGAFGEEAKEKHLQQTAGGKVNIIIAGRSESLVSFNAISDKPIFGHGSWAESPYYYYMYLTHMESVGKDVNWGATDAKERFLIPSHSMLFGAWVYHGIFGAIFWLFVLYLTLKTISQTIGTPGSTPLMTIELLVLLVLLWDIFFSPFGQARRCIEAIYIVVVCVILAEASNKKTNQPN
jgi:hypothetical protein